MADKYSAVRRMVVLRLAVEWAGSLGMCVLFARAVAVYGVAWWIAPTVCVVAVADAALETWTYARLWRGGGRG